jgi:hypothetical protein
MDTYEAIDFHNHKNLQKQNKFGQRKDKDITRARYKCPASLDNCCECGSNACSKELRKAKKTRMFAKRRLPVDDELPEALQEVCEVEPVQRDWSWSFDSWYDWC